MLLSNNCTSPVAMGRDLVLSERPRVAKRISYSEKVASLQNEILEIESMIESLITRRMMLRRNINRLSPPSLLPPEILTEIFKVACQPSVSDDNDAQSQRPLTPLFFGAICKEWREIAWSTPLLWNSVSLHISRKTNNNNNNSRVQLLHDWLLRAKSSPLHIKLTMDDEHEPNFCSLRSIMEVLATRSSHWSSLDTLLPSQCNDILKDNHFPLLTSVCIRPPKGTISTFSEPPNMFLSAPKLLDVDLSGYNFSGMVLPWNQLRRFKTQFLTVGECLKVLGRSQNLKECHLESVYSPMELLALPLPASTSTSTSSTLTSTPPPLFSDLQVLDVVLIKSSAISLLESVVLPSLSDLRVQYSGPGGSLLPAITALVIRSSCKLRSLHIEKKSFHEDDLIPCLASLFFSLTNLRLITLGVGESETADSSSGMTAKLIAMMHPSYQSGNPLLPQLKTLEYRGPIRCDEDSLMSMLVDRFRWRCHSTSTSIDNVEQRPWEREQSRSAQLTCVTIISPEVKNFSNSGVPSARLLKEGMVLDIRSS